MHFVGARRVVETRPSTLEQPGFWEHPISQDTVLPDGSFQRGEKIHLPSSCMPLMSPRRTFMSEKRVALRKYYWDDLQYMGLNVYYF